MKQNKDPKSKIVPQKLTRESKFKFSCHKGLSCFTKCCSDIRIILTPYDILRMKQRLNVDTATLIREYGRIEHLEKSRLPVITLKMLEDEKKSCPFITPEGCTIYSDRPATCRYYPVGFAAIDEKAKNEKEEFFFFIKEDHCLGFEEDTEWTVQSWREDQQPELYDKMNRDWTEILIKKHTIGQKEKVSDKSLKLFFMVSYDLDQFRQFVFESPFLEKFDISTERVEKMEKDDLELMLFGLSWLRTTLFGEELAPTKGS